MYKTSFDGTDVFDVRPIKVGQDRQRHVDERLYSSEVIHTGHTTPFFIHIFTSIQLYAGPSQTLILIARALCRAQCIYIKAMHASSADALFYTDRAILISYLVQQRWDV